ncbi:CD276 antigen [Merluccius polli]|uniref:CD276 antigen n=1 Tax=Merluccius polli TaxID=89951 RepID=A0AA47MU23_MERPO|nr:CD276 antigen [Merluccius polli]
MTVSLLVQTVVLLTAVDLVQGAPQVVCVFGGSCLLPCSFQPKSNTVLHWVKKNGKDVNVHSYYEDQDQPKYQDPLYKGRTSLFPDQISGGNASLRLARVDLQDQGTYLCYARGDSPDKYITLTVRAPVGTVDIMLVNDTVTCKSGGIYPRPELTWSISPRPATALQNTTVVHEDDQGLYDISGSLRTVYTESVYSCSVQNEHGARTATMRQNPPQVDCVFGGSCLLPCSFQPKSNTVLHWVKKNGKDVNVHSYYYDQDQPKYQDPLYKGRTSLFPDQISGGNASLRLARVDLQDQGTYMCYARGNSPDKYVTLTVRAPVGTVDIMLVNDTVTCKSGGIYPRPELTWSISPHPATALQNTTEVHEDDQGLYDVSGSLRTVYTESVYSCSVQNEHGARTATMRQNRKYFNIYGNRQKCKSKV